MYIHYICAAIEYAYNIVLRERSVYVCTSYVLLLSMLCTKREKCVCMYIICAAIEYALY